MSEPARYQVGQDLLLLFKNGNTVTVPKDKRWIFQGADCSHVTATASQLTVTFGIIGLHLVFIDDAAPTTQYIAGAVTELIAATSFASQAAPYRFEVPPSAILTMSGDANASIAAFFIELDVPKKTFPVHKPVDINVRD